MATIKRRPVPSASSESRQSQPLIQPESDEIATHRRPSAHHHQAHEEPKELLSPVSISPVSPVSDPDPDHHAYRPVSHDMRATKESPAQYHHYAVGNASERRAYPYGVSPDLKATAPPQDGHPRYHTLRFWLWEILALLLAVGLMAAKVVLLFYFEGQEIPEWPLSINLSTLLALFSIIQRAALLLILAEIIGQAKWMWFAERDRPLFHLEEFNEAGRSTLGALQLIFVGLVNRARITVKSLILIAALTTVLSFSIGPLTQQAINQEACRQLVSSETASIPAAQFVPGTGTNIYRRINAGQWDVDAGMRGAMLNGLTNPEGKDTAVQAQCSSGECDFADYGTGITYSSIAMCSRCLDASTVMTEPHRNFNVSLGDRAWVAASTGAPRISVQASSLDYAKSLFDEDFATAAPGSMLNLSMLSIVDSSCGDGEGQRACRHNWSDKWPANSDVVAASCILYPCLESYSGSVSGGSLKEKVVLTQKANMASREPTAGSPDLFDRYLRAFQSPCILDNGTWYTAENVSTAKEVPGRIFTNVTLEDRNTTAPEECLYHMYAPYYLAVQSALREMMEGTCVSDTRLGNKAACGDSWWLLSLYNNGSATPESLGTHIGSLTTAMTNHFRKTGEGAWTGYDADGLETYLPAGVRGSTYRTTSCTTVDWRWLIPPIVFVAVTALLLIWVMLRSRFRDKAQPVWKASILPLLYYGLKGSQNDGAKYARMDGMQQQQQQQQQMDRTGKLADLAELKGMAKRRMVQFENGGKGLDAGFYAGKVNQGSRYDSDVSASGVER